MGELFPSCSAFILEVDPESPSWSGGSLSCWRAANHSPVWINGSLNSEMSKAVFGFPLVTSFTRPIHATSPRAEEKGCFG